MCILVNVYLKGACFDSDILLRPQVVLTRLDVLIDDGDRVFKGLFDVQASPC